MTRVLVTGASGFVGRYALADLVARGVEVHTLGRRVPDSIDERGVARTSIGPVHHHGDLLDVAATRATVAAIRPTHLLHLAWFAQPGLFWTSLENLRWVAASLQLYLAFAEAGGTRCVAAGSCAEYDWRFAELDEVRTPAVPATLYGTAKLALYEILAAAGRHTGVSLGWGRIFFVYGPHEARGRLVSDVAEALVAGRDAPCTEGRQERDYMHVADVGGAFAALLASDVTGVVNIASGACVPVRQVVTTLGRLAGAPERVRLGAVPARAGDPTRLAASTARLTDEVGFRPRVDLEVGLVDTLAWWRQQVYGATSNTSST